MKFDRIWISSIEHLKSFRAIRDNASFFDKMFGRYNVPANFPSVRSSGHTFPIVYTDAGSVEISENTFEFTSIPQDDLLGNKYLNIHSRNFTLGLSDIKKIDYYYPKAAIIPFYDYPYIHLETGNEGLPGFLCCCGGYGPRTKKIKNRTERLKSYLEAQLN